MKLERFLVKIKNRTLGFKSDYHKDLFDKFLAQFEDQEVWLEIKEKRSERSNQQNRYYWLYLGIISEESGHSPEELHLYFKGKHLTQRIKEVYGNKVRITKSTTSLSKGEFCDYLANISIETGVELPDTNDYWGFSYHK